MYEYEDLTNYGKGKAILDKLEMVSGAPKTPEEISLDEAVAELEHQQKTNPNDTKEIERLKKDVHFMEKKLENKGKNSKKLMN